MTIKPMPGFAHVAPENKYQDTGLIVIPDRYKGRKMAVGRVESWTPGRKIKCRQCGNLQHTFGSCRHCQSRKVFQISKGPVNPFGNEDITGQRVIYAESSFLPIQGDLFRLPVDDILAVIPDDVVLDDAERTSGVKRCRFCGPAKEGTTNAMLLVEVDGKLVCPRCHKDGDGNANRN